jgi:uncharacterized protein (DUF2384 family)
MLRLRSGERPFSDVAVAGQAARLLAVAEATGIWEPHELVESLDEHVFNDVLKAVAAAGVAGHALFDWTRHADESAEHFANWIKTVRDDVAESAVPELELPRLDLVLGADRLAALVGVASSSLRRYMARQRELPDDVARRIHFLALVVGDLAGAYNERGIRRWFDRPRPQLDHRAPAEVLSGKWDPDDERVTKVAALAAALAG